ncbi:SigE family RNA polymerase sigma factor [Isoptericola chiayiensis]|uniref:SigE family RNA polymerase sigma factor n=1 Tax=Isoptericola chiayiensis TaxID=579446 RepID=A0ABP8Y8F7_9MICO|nr:RNA polymerase sigma-70 factor (sigma-E family) [Isoptericola chiayiensis]
MPEAWTPVVVAGAGDRSGRDQEFAAFMAEAEPVLARTAYLLTGDRHRAEELVQQALVKTYVAWPRARGRDPLAYARRVLANARIDAWRKHRRERLVGPDELPHGRHGGADEGQADRDLLVRALAELPQQRRRVVVLRYLVDLGEQEVAEDLGISRGAVKSAASRGLAQLRSALAGTGVHEIATGGAR